MLQGFNWFTCMSQNYWSAPLSSAASWSCEHSARGNFSWTELQRVKLLGLCWNGSAKLARLLAGLFLPSLLPGEGEQPHQAHSSGCKQEKELSLQHGALPWVCLLAFTPKLGYKHHPSLAEELQCPSNLVPVPSRFGAMIWKKGVQARSQSWELLFSLTAVI